MLVVSSLSPISSYPCIVANCRFLWWGGRLKQRRYCPGLLELFWIVDSTIQAATGCCGFPERVATSLPFIRIGVVKMGKEQTAINPDQLRALLPLTSFPTHGLFLSLLPHTQKKRGPSYRTLEETPQTQLIIFSLACRHVKLKLLEPTHLSKGF